MDSDDTVKRWVGHLSVMLSGAADIVETDGKYEVKIEVPQQNVSLLTPALFTAGLGHNTPPSAEAKLMFLLGVVRTWHTQIEKMVQEQCKDLNISDAVDLGNGQTGLIGDGGAKA